MVKPRAMVGGKKNVQSRWVIKKNLGTLSLYQFILQGSVKSLEFLKDQPKGLVFEIQI